MIIRMYGKIEKLTPTSIELNVNDIVYFIEISLFTSIALRDGKNEKICLEIAQILREDSDLLYGFYTKQERDIFLRLLKINGVGAKLALSILSTYSSQSFSSIIAKKDLKSLIGVKGVGKNLASKIMLDLSGVLISQDCVSDNANLKLVKDALSQLGYKENDIKNAINTLDNEVLNKDSSEIVKIILKSFSKA